MGLGGRPADVGWPPERWPLASEKACQHDLQLVGAFPDWTPVAWLPILSDDGRDRF